MNKDKLLHWKRADTVIVLAVTLLYSLFAFVNLGSTTAPQTYWQSTQEGECVVLDLGESHTGYSMLYYCYVSNGGFSVSISADGEAWSDEVSAEMDQGMCYQWKYLGGGRTYDEAWKLGGRYVRIRADRIGLRLAEVILRDTETVTLTDTDEDGVEFTYEEKKLGCRIDYTVISHAGGNPKSANYSEGGRIADEQDSLKGDPSWFNSTYFDEIYHARTAYEHLHGQSAYETSHPPLGKLLMSIPIALFGMTPFAWRFAGTLAGVIMLPALYLLVKQLTKKTLPAALAMGLLSLDCMHFTQTRIATIDSFPVLFILLSSFFMLRFMQTDLGSADKGQFRKLLPDLALSGFFMGCGIASKWIVFYTAAGLAVCYFWTCAGYVIGVRRQSPSDREALKKALLRVLFLCLWCVLFFIVVPAVIYLLCYIPFFSSSFRDGSIRSVGDFFEKWFYVQKVCMFDYHSSPGLGMDHPYYSPWYEWPLSLRPMYYYASEYMPDGLNQSIFCFGNPAVWYISGLAMIATLFALIWSHRYRLQPDDTQFWHLRADIRSSERGIPAFLLIGFLAQFLPWVLVPRGTYIYHYFASVPFLIASLAWLISLVHSRNRQIALILSGFLILFALIFFVILYPYASGTPVPTAWLDLGKRIMNVTYYGG
ncbi:MAG: phospholipid carrier-dependent glycosyltransferase [Clostridia bacterium]|nr:phospholipid carrier-dependent glycosyltransferase [Clostridia bacterium]